MEIRTYQKENNKFLTLGNELVLTPRFNPTSQMVTYLSYFKNLPRVYLLDIETGTQEVVGDFPGMTFTPRISPDGKKAVALHNGVMTIFHLDLDFPAILESICAQFELH